MRFWRTAPGSSTPSTAIHVSETAVEDGKVKVRGEFQKVSTISASLQKRLLENGMPPRLLEQIAGGRMDIDDGKEETA